MSRNEHFADELAKHSQRTQISRQSVTTPTRVLMERYPDRLQGSILHHGEGKAGADTDALGATGYDPYAAREESRNREHLSKQYDTVVSNFVFNTLPPQHRSSVRDEMLGAVKPGGRAIVSLRSDRISGTPHEDGVVTSKGTFQKSYNPDSALADFSHPDFDVSVLHNGGHFLTVEAVRKKKR